MQFVFTWDGRSGSSLAETSRMMALSRVNGTELELKAERLGDCCGVIVTVGRIFPGTGLATGASRVRLLATNMLPTALLVWQLSPSIVPLRTKPSSATQSRECA